MRIIAGQWRGRPLAAPKGDATRPTADRTREALFSMLTSRVGSFEDLAVADLFAGSGALGFEALSRGAASCLFVEQDRAALDALRANAEKLGVRADIRATSVLALGPAPKPMDLILFRKALAGPGGGKAASNLQLSNKPKAVQIEAEPVEADPADAAPPAISGAITNPLAATSTHPPASTRRGSYFASAIHAAR